MIRKPTAAQKVIITLLCLNLLSAGAEIWHREKTLETVQQQVQVNAETIETVSGQLDSLQLQMDEVKAAHETTQEKVEDIRREVSRGYSRGMDVVVTAYDLSEASCNKGPSHPAYGLTATGRSLAGHTLESARAIAVDPSVIPLGSKVRIKFKDADMQKYNGIYTASDTGGAIHGNRIDLFAGEGAHDLAMRIGRRHAVAVVL